MTDEPGDTDAGDSYQIKRRTVLAATGGAVVVGAVPGTASAHSSQFYGCSQVCTDTDGDRAVVYTGDGYECRDLDKQDPESYSERNNVPWAPWASACYEYDPEEEAAVVAVIYDKEEACYLCLNPNRCAQNYVSSAEALIDDLDLATCGDNCEELGVGVGTCDDVYDARGGRGGGPPEDAGPPENRGARGRGDPPEDAGPPENRGARGRGP